MQYYWDFITGDFHQNGLLQSVHINKSRKVKEFKSKAETAIGL
jgi:hypothetical protein